jgi:hippurate hydrolase
MGTGEGEDTVNVHNPRYDFNDRALAIGGSYWVALAEQQLQSDAVRQAA